MKLFLANVIALVITIALVGCSRESVTAAPVTETPVTLSSSTSSEFSESNPKEPEVLVLPVVGSKAEKLTFNAKIVGYAEETRIRNIWLKPSNCSRVLDDSHFDGKLENGKSLYVHSGTCTTSEVTAIVIETTKGVIVTPVTIQ